MSNKLRFDLMLKTHPYPDDPTTRLEAWGRFTVDLMTPDSQILLIDWEWNLELLAEWFLEHQFALCHDSLPEQVKGCVPDLDESLAETLDRCYHRDYSEFTSDYDHFRWFNELDIYREKHSLTAALPGARIPPILIGCNHGTGEISLNTENAEDENGKWWNPKYTEKWKYTFDMEGFCYELRKALQQFLINWGAESQDTDVQARSYDLVSRLADDIKGPGPKLP